MNSFAASKAWFKKKSLLLSLQKILRFGMFVFTSVCLYNTVCRHLEAENVGCIFGLRRES